MTAFLLASFLRGPVTYTQPGFDAFDVHQRFRSVGVFGSFGKGTENQTRDFFGLPTFTVRTDAPQSTLVWANFLDGKDLVLGHASLPGTLLKKRFNFLDWTTGELTFSTQTAGRTAYSSALFSRCFPAVLYQTQASHWSWIPRDLRADWIGYRDVHGRFVKARAGSKIGRLGAPWVLLWPDPASTKEVEPMLVRFQRQPARLSLEKELSAEFSGQAGSIGVMPLFGVRRVSGGSWLPKAVRDAEFWSRAMAAFPVRMNETFSVDDTRQTVRITDRVVYRSMKDDWGTRVLKLAPVSPVTGIAAQNGYPVNSSSIVRTDLATLLGPFAYVRGDRFSYEIPIPSSRDNMLSPVKITGDPARERESVALNQLVAKQTIKPDDTSDGGLNLQLKEYSQAYPLLSPAVQAKIRPALAAAFDASYSPSNLTTVADPVTGAKYLMCNKIWCADQPYDREWYAGRQLDAAYEYTAWVDPKAYAKHWKQIQGLYDYFRIYDDWAWSGTLSSVFAYALTGDGMNFSMEGMLGVARLAKRHGDGELWKDATYRAAKEALCTYASWFMTDWEKQIDYVTWTDTSYDYQKKKGRYEIRRMAPKDAQTGFGLDIYSDTTGIKVFRNGSFWHASAAVFWNNPALDRLYLERLYGKVLRWEYVTLPRLHPKWTDRNAIERFSNQAYGSNMVSTHVAARAVLFGQKPSQLAALESKIQPGLEPLYKVRSACDLVESGVPQVWLPTPFAEVRDASWNKPKRTLSCRLVGISSHEVNIDWRWPTGPTPKPDAGPKPARVRMNGKRVSLAKVKGGFWRASTKLAPGETVLFEARY
ncbi:MAG TPA: hypothetical protein VG944_11840 [Fimbriimonas sp.]|nr:hypothetical protein [Fimbriimonas sp.]